MPRKMSCLVSSGSAKIWILEFFQGHNRVCEQNGLEESFFISSASFFPMALASSASMDASTLISLGLSSEEIQSLLSVPEQIQEEEDDDFKDAENTEIEIEMRNDGVTSISSSPILWDDEDEYGDYYDDEDEDDDDDDDNGDVLPIEEEVLRDYDEEESELEENGLANFEKESNGQDEVNTYNENDISNRLNVQGKENLNKQYKSETSDAPKDTTELDNDQGQPKAETVEETNEWWKDPFARFEKQSGASKEKEKSENSDIMDALNNVNDENNYDDDDDEYEDESEVYDMNLEEEVENMDSGFQNVEGTATDLKDDFDVLESTETFSKDSAPNIMEEAQPQDEYYDEEYDSESDADERRVDVPKPRFERDNDEEGADGKDQVDSYAPSLEMSESREKSVPSVPSLSSLPIMLLPKIGRTFIHSPVAVQIFAAGTLGNIALQRLGWRKRMRSRKSNGAAERNTEHASDGDVMDATSRNNILDENIYEIHSDIEEDSDYVVVDDHDDIGGGFGRPIANRNNGKGIFKNGNQDQSKEVVLEVKEDLTDRYALDEETAEDLSASGKPISLTKKQGKVQIWARRKGAEEQTRPKHGGRRMTFFRGRQKLEMEVSRLNHEVDILLQRATDAESARDQFENDCDMALHQLREVRKELEELSRTNTYLKNQLVDNKKVMERAVNAERLKTTTELARLREQMVEILERERRIMRAQLSKQSAEVRSMIADSIEDDAYEYVEEEYDAE